MEEVVEMFMVVIFHNNEKNLEVMVEKPELSKFLKCIINNEPYWNDDQNSAFWTPEDQIRYIMLRKQKEDDIDLRCAKEDEEISKKVTEFTKKLMIEKTKESLERISKISSTPGIDAEEIMAKKIKMEKEKEILEDLEIDE